MLFVESTVMLNLPHVRNIVSARAAVAPAEANKQTAKAKNPGFIEPLLAGMSRMTASGVDVSYSLDRLEVHSNIKPGGRAAGRCRRPCSRLPTGSFNDLAACAQFASSKFSCHAIVASLFASHFLCNAPGLVADHIAMRRTIIIDAFAPRCAVALI